MKNKYQIDDIVYFRVENDIRCSKIKTISYSRGIFYHVETSISYWTSEKKLYSTFKEAQNDKEEK